VYLKQKKTKQNKTIDLKIQAETFCLPHTLLANEMSQGGVQSSSARGRRQ